jgi:hypothetical protein
VSVDRAGDLARLREQRDQALRDILALEQQVASGEIPVAAAQKLRRGYERSVAQALDDDMGAATVRGAVPPPHRVGRGRVVAYLLAVAVAVLAAVVVLPAYLGARPTNGFVTGNEPRQSLAAQSPPSLPAAAPGPSSLPSVAPDQSAPLTALAAVVAANPDDDAARLALANLYTADGRYEQAAQQYSDLLQRSPTNTEARARYAWLLLQIGLPQQALTMVNQALTADPLYQDGLWVLANIQLYGLDDPGAALTALRQLQQRPNLPAVVRSQATALAAIATQRAGQR